MYFVDFAHFVSCRLFAGPIKGPAPREQCTGPQ